MRYLILLVFLLGCSRSPYQKVKNISTPTYREINKAMKKAKPHQ